MSQDRMTSRFIIKSDPKAQKFVFDLPLRPHWASRPYEYDWASRFAGSQDVVLDAACGVPHPLKFYLAKHCQTVFACDLDQRLVSPEQIVKAIIGDFGHSAVRDFSWKLIRQVNFAICSITSLPYLDEMFDRVYCISVLEHLNDIYNQKPGLRRFRMMIDKLYPQEIYLSLKEFKRVLKKNGLIILTFDLPRIDLDYFRQIVAEIELEFAGPANFEIPLSALYTPEYNLYYFRAVLQKKN